MDVQVADRFFTRLIGLMGKYSMSIDEGIYFPRCSAVHTCFMRFPILVVFCREGQIVKLLPVLKPWRYAVCGEADSVFEFVADERVLQRIPTIIRDFFSETASKKRRGSG